MPTKTAAFLSQETALIALPIIVFLKNKWSAMMTQIVTAITHKYCGNTVAPKIRKGASPEKEGRMNGSDPQAIKANDLIRNEPPMVMKIKNTVCWDLAGRIADLSNTAPKNVTVTMAKGTERTNGIPRNSKKVTANNPPSVTNSHWAKFMMPLALCTTPNPMAISE